MSSSSPLKIFISEMTGLFLATPPVHHNDTFVTVDPAAAQPISSTLIFVHPNFTHHLPPNGSQSVDVSLQPHHHPQEFLQLLNLTWPRALAVSVFFLLILVTVVGNTLVILAVSTTRRLRTVTNCFVMNLAITDWLVGTCVMPPAVVLYVVGSWRFGWILCDIWISLDVLLCTASILSLCAISLDRYLAIIQPLTYSKKLRSKRLALCMILIVWVVAFSITCPPILGWYEPGRKKKDYVECRYNQNKGYVVFSAMGSFFIPLSVMVYVYIKIGIVLSSRRQRIQRAEVSEKLPDYDYDCDNFVTESEHGGKCSPTKQSSFKSYKSKTYDNDLSRQSTLYELLEISRSSSTIRCSTITCKYAASNPAQDGANGTATTTPPMQSIQFTESHTSFSESCLSATKFKVNNNHSNSGKCYHHHQHHSHSHHPAAQMAPNHRMPMRISTLKKESKTAKTLTIVMGGFIACWLPFFIYYLLIPFLPREAVFESLMSFLTWVGWVNCAINPFIYAFYNPDFRTAFWRLTFRKMFKRQPNHLTMFKG